MNNLSEIIKKRSAPGILIFDLQHRLLHSNQEALEILTPLNGGAADWVSMPQEIKDICRQLEINSHTLADAQGINQQCSLLNGRQGTTYSLRAFLLGPIEKGMDPSHMIVLMERIIEKHQIDIEKARRDCCLSYREVEVVRLVCAGLSNKEISEKIFIAESTVKGHIKNIMRKMRVSSRNEIAASLRS